MSKEFNIEAKFKKDKAEMLQVMNKFRKADKEFLKAKEDINENVDALNYSLKETVSKNKELVNALNALKEVTLKLSALGKV